MTSKKEKIIVAMSGGIDSSVSALLLKEQGYDITGVFLKNWEEDSFSTCNSNQEYEMVAKVCDHLQIPYYALNFAQEYRERVFKNFLEQYSQGLTPNPDILCNQEIKFQVFLEQVFQLGSQKLATGHYCQIHHDSQTNSYFLHKGLDPQKDQSYFLHSIRSDYLKNILFPIGHLTKKEVRDIAKKSGLPNHDKKDSMGICFIEQSNFNQFIKNYLKQEPGDILDLDGNILGQHQGLWYHTIGQRKGLGLGGPGDAYYVAKKNLQKNSITVVRGNDHSALFTHELFVNHITFLGSIPSLPLKCQAKVRYRQTDQDCTLLLGEDGRYHVHFKNPQRAITLGQSVVFYLDERCLGGGIITGTGSSLFEQEKLISPSSPSVQKGHRESLTDVRPNP